MFPNPATTLASQTRLMTSKLTERTYRISISLPLASFESANKSWPFDQPLQKWPVVYLTDANFFFGMMTELTRMMSWCGSTHDAIIVGIGYPEDVNPQEAWRDAIVGRTHDFIPLRDEALEKNDTDWLKRPVITGGAPRFLQFIQQELVPMVEKEFPTDPKKRVLVGHSLGGLFAAYALFEAPGLFDTYLVSSPALTANDGYVFKQEEQFAKRRKRLPAKVYLSVGELEESVDDRMVTNAIRFGVILESRKYKGLILHRQIFHGLNHCEVVAPGFQAGLKLALKKD